MTRRILVLGAGGFIGKHVVAALGRCDWATAVPAGRRAVSAAGVRVDATDAAALRQALVGIDGIVNCVAGSNEAMVVGARTLFDVAGSLAQPPRIVHLSSMAVYGESVGDVEETFAVGASSSPYGAAKLEAERLAAVHPSVVILRLGIVYGPDSAQWSGRIGQLLTAHRLGDLGGGGDGYCNLVYVEDAAAAVLAGLRLSMAAAPSASPGAPAPATAGIDAAASRIFNLSLTEPPTWNEYFLRYAQALGAVPLSRISGRRLRIEGKLLAPPLKIAEIAAGKLAPRLARVLPQPIPPSLLRLFRQEIRLNVGKARRELEFRETPLDEGLRHTAAWYRAGGG